MATMTKRKVHPARRARVATAVTSTTGFLAVISSLAWNTHVAEAANLAVAKVEVIAPATIQTAPVQTPSAAPKISTTPAATQSNKATSTGVTVPTQTIAPAVPVAPVGTNVAAPTLAPATPVAPAVVYTCMSPGGKTESPTASGSCQNARYGYALTQI